MALFENLGFLPSFASMSYYYTLDIAKLQISLTLKSVVESQSMYACF